MDNDQSITSTKSNTVLEPSSNYCEIDEDKIQLWQAILVNSNESKTDIERISDSDLLTADITPNRQSHIIKSDVLRTRFSERGSMDSFQDYGVLFLSFYCKVNDIEYKQGLNELVGPFILLKEKVKVSFTAIYRLFSAFINKFATNYYWEPDFYSLQSSLCLVSLLLQYHDPEVSNYLNYNLIEADMYATSWFLTLFANKLPLRLVYHLWHKLIVLNDSLFLHFLIVSLVIQSRKDILSAEYSQIPYVMCKLCFTSEVEIDDVIEKAIDMSRQTPHSFRLLSDRLEIFKYHSTKLKELYESFKMESLLALPIFPSEIMALCYEASFGCVDSSCIRYGKGITRGIHSKALSKCYYCHSSIYDNKLAYAILDLRLLQEDNVRKEEGIKQPQGYLPKSILFNEEQLLSDAFSDIIQDSLRNEKAKSHFILLTSQTDYYYEYEQVYYNQEEIKEDEKNRRFGLLTKVNKELNIKVVNSHIEKDRSHHLPCRIKEFDNFKKAISSLLNSHYPYVSFAFGGFKAVHHECIRSIQLENHNKSQCQLCQEPTISDDFIVSVKKLWSTPQPKRRLISFISNGNSEVRLDLQSISQLIANPSVSHFCCLRKHHNPETFVFLFLENKAMKVYSEDSNSDSLTYLLANKIPFDSIVSINEDNPIGNILTIVYELHSEVNGKMNSKQLNSLTVDFTSHIDSKDFKQKIFTKKELQ